MLDRMFLITGGPGETGWFNTYGTAYQPEPVYVDSNDNVYASSGYLNRIVKYDSTGSIIWQRQLSISSPSSSPVAKQITADSSGNVYVVGVFVKDSNALEGITIIKYNSSGTHQWTRTLDNNVYDHIGYDITIDSSGNVYIIGLTDLGDWYPFIAKYNSSGTLQWQKRFSAKGEGYGITLDSSGNIYITGTLSSTESALFVAKLDSAGSITWVRTLTGGAYGAVYHTGRRIKIGASGDIYVAGTYYMTYAQPGGIEILILKYNSSGTLLWQRAFTYQSDNQFSDMDIDSSDNIYISNYLDNVDSGNAADQGAHIAKYDSSGTLQWQRRFKANTTSMTYDKTYGIGLGSNGSFYVAGYSRIVGSNTTQHIAKLPVSGGLTGTYTLNGVQVMYGSGVCTSITTSSTSSTNNSITTTATTLTAGTPTVSSTTTTYTPTLVTI